MVWPVKIGKGVLMNCTKVRPSLLCASSRSPAISGAPRLGRHTTCPGCIDQPDWEKSTGGKRGTVLQPTKTSRLQIKRPRLKRRQTRAALDRIRYERNVKAAFNGGD